MTTTTTEVEQPTKETDGKAGWIQTIVRASLTLILLGLSIWWLAEVASRLGTAPTKDTKGNIIVDQYQRAKDILLVVLPLVTTALGYWFGSQGKDKAETAANAAKDETQNTKEQLAGVKAVVSTNPELLERAKHLYPKAFPD